MCALVQYYLLTKCTYCNCCDPAAAALISFGWLFSFFFWQDVNTATNYGVAAEQLLHASCRTAVARELRAFYRKNGKISCTAKLSALLYEPQH
jgi:hypothetical protein